MCYEESWIDGLLFWRGTPDGEWHPVSAPNLCAKVQQRDSHIAELEAELQEQARLNGMGSEREAKLMARVAGLERATDVAIEINNGHQQRITELERQLATATDAAAKGDLARANAGGMEMRIQELEKALREIAAIENEMVGHDWDEIEKARGIAIAALGL